MRPKGKLFALVAVFAAIAVVTASGAFTTVSAERTATVTTAGDASALLQLEPADTNNGDLYASTPSGQLEISLENVNLNAHTEIDYVFNITNNGNEDVYIWITKTGTNNQYVTFYDGEASTGTVINDSSNAQLVTSGSSLNVSMTIDTRGSSLAPDAELLTDIEVHANSTDPSP